MARIRVRARTLDLLGRQQMASIPNALHELFKNAYDAYADTTRVDYFRAESLLIIKDDGVGMTSEDFQSRWLTLGTESKSAGGNGLAPPYRDPDKDKRPTLGSKGIGRLAIATIGPQVFVVSQAQRDDGLQGMVISLLNWTFFEVPGLDLDAIEIPLVTLPPGESPSGQLLENLVDALRQNLKTLEGSVPDDYAERISSDLDRASAFIPSITELISQAELACKRGTAFIVLPVDRMLERDIDESGEEGVPPTLLKILLGFANTMMPSDTPPPMVPSFFDHKRDGSVEDLIGSKVFFTPEEFDSADHHIEGQFDEYGQFTGALRIYRGEPQTYTVPWDGAHGQETSCGPFFIKFAYAQGNQSESLMPEDSFKAISAKLSSLGGLYVYRDGVRILPYGNSDYDYLNIELRRAKAAKDWFFTYRRFFGVIELSHKHNSNLNEKAGREGFRENLAYRQFRNILVNLLKQMAMDWFREKTATYGNFREQLSDLQENAKLLDKREKSSLARRNKLKATLDVFFQSIENRVPEMEIEMLRAVMDRTLEHVRDCSPEDAARELLKLESELSARLYTLRESFRVVKPRGVGLTKSMQKDIERSSAIFAQLDREFFSPFEQCIDESVTRAIGETRALVSRRRRIHQAIELRNKRDKQKAGAIVRETRQDTGNLTKEVVRHTREGLRTMDSAFKNAFITLEKQDLSKLEGEALSSFRDSLNKSLESVVSDEFNRLERLRDQIQVTLESTREGTSLNEVTAAIEEKSQLLEEKLGHYTELAELGAAIGIIQHEFGASVNGIRAGLKELRNWTDNSPGMKESFFNIKSSFEHLESYLNMFTPLDRRLYRKTIAISGKLIRKYLLNIFGERFRRHGVEWKSTSEFEGHTVEGYPSTFLPPIINIVDNALFWLTRDSTGALLKPDGPRLITFDADEDGYLIGNSGPGIPERDADRIFEFTFTRKLRGRGMGLAVAKKALNDAGFDISLETSGQDTHPLFRISTSHKSA
ncbi:MAG: ATP-binding protein [Desulfovibrionaceae bacterium]